jgi:hypothetical protein
MLKDFNKQTKWSVMRNLIFEIDDLIIDSLGIVAFISFFVGGWRYKQHLILLIPDSKILIGLQQGNR